ncbi:hypothetical protein LVD17_19230 [Fulvivirga ulvae]|uniref:hypothetical protein n=1 Tax=Fulvivirga ulvae TaxID=2904245 RepID=UPI001F25DC0A|nr:hypothetical protein [Fulvivirga ulvae]UII30428.1 hypothetical protein LVD17_19230 [Fulvivirga ulvae]
MRTMITAFALCVSMLMYSCEEENSIEPVNNDVDHQPEELVLVPKTLATINLANGNVITFRSEADGIVYDESGSGEMQDELAGVSMLERFLSLTEENLAVPEDFIAIEEDERLIALALKRGVTSQHETAIFAKVKGTDTGKLMASAWCSGQDFYDTDAYGQFYRTFHNYPWGGANVTVYSSWKSGADKCKTVNLYLVNCSGSNTLSADTWYKNAFGNYKRQDVINVGPGGSKFWSKTYTTKRYRRVFVSGFGSGRFGGTVVFKNY